MEIGIQLIRDHYLPYPDNDFKMIADAGFDSIAFDLSLFCLPHELISASKSEKKGQALSPRQKVACSLTGSIEDIKMHFLPYKTEAIKNGLKFSQMNAPSASQIPDSSEKMMILQQIIRNCIEVCGWMDSPYLTVHPFPTGSLNSRQEWLENRDFFLSLAPIAREHHVILCLENQYNDCNGRYLRGVCSDPHTAADYVDRLNHEVGEELFGFCLNTGKCNFFGQNLYEMVIKLGKRIRTVRIQDNNGIWDQRSMPYACSRDGMRSTTDWQGFVRGMREISFHGVLSFAADGSVNNFPSNMRSSVLRLIGAAGRFMAEQIEIENSLSQCGQVVLFGAGNMFENYMSSYGDKYRPLFTVDNNSKLWGTSKLGVSVRAPEAIKELTGDYGIFICNQFYYEIEQQLADMGVKRIYHFHDEYRPLR